MPRLFWPQVVLWASCAGACSGSIREPHSLAAAAPDAFGGDPTSGCVPGLQVACGCADGMMGITVCRADGKLGPCECTRAGAPIATAGPGTTSQPDSPVVAPPPPEPPKPPLAMFVRISQLALYQPVKTPLVERGSEVVDRIAPVIAHKSALLRVFVETLPGYTPRDLTAVLDVGSGSGTSMMPMTVTARLETSSNDADLKSTLNIELPAELLREDLRYAIALQQAPGDEPSATAAPDPDVRFPKQEGEFAELGARDPGPFRVMIVPYRYQADRSGRLPTLDEEEINRYRAYLQALYPTSDIQLELHEPLDYQPQIGQERGWSEWLEALCALRTEEDPDPKVFYYGMAMPKASFREYGGGVVGVSYLPGPAANYGRCSVGAGFKGFAFVAAHELGHALGLEHAPCGTGERSPYPYEGSSIGVWAYDSTTGKLVDPAKAKDLMAYCEPSFISDYNYRRLFNRIRFLNVQFDRRSDDAAVDAEPIAYHRVLVDPVSGARVRGTTRALLPPGGPEELRSLTLLDSAGAPIGESDAYYFPFSEADTGVWLIPDSGAAAVRLDGVGEVQLY